MTWIRLMTEDPSELKSASEVLHHAGQYITMAANHFIPKKEDDSHTNADWYHKKNWLIGNAIESPYGKIHVALDYPLLMLIVCDDNFKPIAEIELSGKTKLEGFNWLNNQLWKHGLEVGHFESDLHYSIPDHPVFHGAKFEMSIPKHFFELANYRSNGHALLRKVSERFVDKSDLKIWPHHFDEGILITLKKEGEESIAMISMGLSIADQYYPCPYFYVNPWKKDGIEYSDYPKLPSGGKWHTSEWTGQVLSADHFAGILHHDHQELACQRFLEEALINAERILLS